MGLFGDKKLVEALQTELATARTELAAERATREALAAQRETLQRELARAQAQLTDYEQRLNVLAAPRRTVSRGGRGAPPLELAPRVDEAGDPVTCSASYTIDGAASQLEALDLVLRMVTSAGELGSTVFFDVMVDGDGDGRLVARRDGEVLRLTDHEIGVWFGGEEAEQSERIRDVAREGGRIIVELV